MWRVNLTDCQIPAVLYVIYSVMELQDVVYPLLARNKTAQSFDYYKMNDFSLKMKIRPIIPAIKHLLESRISEIPFFHF